MAMGTKAGTATSDFRKFLFFIKKAVFPCIAKGLSQVFVHPRIGSFFRLRMDTMAAAMVVKFKRTCLSPIQAINRADGFYVRFALFPVRRISSDKEERFRGVECKNFMVLVSEVMNILAQVPYRIPVGKINA